MLISYFLRLLHIYKPPWGKGPDSQLIYAEDGYTNYLPKKFPKLDSITSCYIVEEVGVAEEL
jgi:hypothetical protein